MTADEREKWDRAAVDYQHTFTLGLNDYNAGLLHFWHEKGMLFHDARVIDIGCGVGKYGTYLAELGYDVTLTDISGEMLRHAADNMARYSSPWTIYQCDFNSISGTESVFSKGFDLAISTMSPAIHDIDTVKKMSAMTRRWCFLARFYEWHQPFRDTLMRKVGMAPHCLFNDLNSDCGTMIQAVSEAGYIPYVNYVNYNWEDLRTPQQMSDYLCRNYFPEDEDRSRLYADFLRESALAADSNGFVHDNVNTRVAWIYWKTEEKNDS